MKILEIRHFLSEDQQDLALLLVNADRKPVDTSAKQEKPLETGRRSQRLEAHRISTTARVSEEDNEDVSPDSSGCRRVRHRGRWREKAACQAQSQPLPETARALPFREPPLRALLEAGEERTRVLGFQGRLADRPELLQREVLRYYQPGLCPQLLDEPRGTQVHSLAQLLPRPFRYVDLAIVAFNVVLHSSYQCGLKLFRA